MAARRGKIGGGPHSFGGDWTETKLQIVGEYLAAYAKVLKGKGFKTAYIDAFAGTGTRTPRRRADPSGSSLLDLFEGANANEPERLLDGSATIALKTEPSFDKYIFIEKNAKRVAELEKLREVFPDRADRIAVRRDDANDAIQSLCAEPAAWRGRRAVLFLDPYGMQVDWETVKAVAETKAIDMWLLFPLGSAVNRLLTRSGEIPDEWRRSLDRFLGTTDWYDDLYKKVEQPSLFGGEITHVEKSTVETIGAYFNKRLESVFAGVAPRPRVLWNSRCPLYLLCFAAANPKGSPTAIKIASYLLERA